MKVGIVMGSKSDYPVVQKAEQMLENFGVEYETRIISAHRTPKQAEQFAADAEGSGFGSGVLFQQHEAAGRLVGFPQSEDALRQLLFAQRFQHLLFRLAAGRCALKCKHIVAGGVHPARPGAA